MQPERGAAAPATVESSVSGTDKYLFLSNVRCNRQHRCCHKFINWWENFLTLSSINKAETKKKVVIGPLIITVAF